MARYHLRVSLTREASLSPHVSGDGPEILEQADGGPSTGIRAESPNGYPTDDPEGRR